MANKSLSSQLYKKLVNEEDARACETIGEEACKEAPGNFIKMLLSLFLSKLGDALINPKITLPWVMQTIGAPAYLLGWLVPIRESGSLLPQLVIASVIRRMPVRKWVWVVGSILQAMAVLGIALVAWRLEGSLAGWLVIGLLVIFSLARGLNSVASKDVLGKTIPKSQRGSLNGWSASGAGLITLAMGAILALGFSENSDVGMYVLGFVGAAILWALAAMVYAGVEEQTGEVDGGRNGLLQAFKRLSLLQTDARFRHFVLTRSLLLCSALSAPFIVVMAQDNIGSSIGIMALFLMASGAASLLSGPFWGRFADTSSRRVMISSGLMAALVGLLVVVCESLAQPWLASLWLLPGLYFVLSVAHQGVRLGRKTYVVNMAEGNQRTDYVSISNTIIGVVLLLVGGVGSLTPIIGLSGVILILSVMGVAGSWMAVRLPEVE
ncbi:MFS transporter [Thalassolituus sp.]|uniref:MFS transporter n=1 Tax=Thalassolituus sp. TaxID=2030822 RepID=UPI002A80EE74|nr:MFS transporter [Thalassolituus sp.]